MLKKFSQDQCASKVRAKASVYKKTKNAILNEYNDTTYLVEEQFPKKGVMHLATYKGGGTKFQFILDQDFVPYFFQIRQGTPIPTLRVLHQFPNILPRFQVDAGAIRFVLKGSDIFCQGLTSAGGSMVDVEEGTVVAIYAEGKQHACAIGETAMSTAEIEKVNNGVGVKLIHYLGDGFWKCKDFESSK